MQWLQKLFRKKSTCQGIVGIGFSPEGIAIAVSNYAENNLLKLVYCEFVHTTNAAEYPVILQNRFVTLNLAHYDCHLVLNPDDYQRIKIDTPPVPEAEIPLAIRWKIADLIDFPVDEAVLDYYPVPISNGNEATLDVIACPNSIIKPKIAHCTQAGLRLKVIDIQETCLRNLAALLPKNEQGVTVLYLQKTFGIILIQKQGIIYLARQINIGYERLNLLNKFDTDSYDNLALEIQRSLDYIESYYRISITSALAIIPWADNSQTLVDKLNDNYGINAYLMDLSALIPCDIPLDYSTQSLCAPVIGATLRHLIAQHDNTAS